MSAVNGT